MDINRIDDQMLTVAIGRAVKRMNFEEMLCLWLITVCDQSHKFVAEMLDEPPRYVSRWYRKALGYVQEELEQMKNENL